MTSALGRRRVSLVYNGFKASTIEGDLALTNKREEGTEGGREQIKDRRNKKMTSDHRGALLFLLLSAVTTIGHQ